MFEFVYTAGQGAAGQNSSRHGMPPKPQAADVCSVSDLGLSSLGSGADIHRLCSCAHRMRALGKSARASAPLVQLELQRARSIKRVLAAVGR